MDTQFFSFSVEISMTKDVNTVFVRVDIFLDDSGMIVYEECVPPKDSVLRKMNCTLHIDLKIQHPGTEQFLLRSTIFKPDFTVHEEVDDLE